MMFSIMAQPHTKCCYAECRLCCLSCLFYCYAKCRYAECRAPFGTRECSEHPKTAIRIFDVLVNSQSSRTFSNIRVYLANEQSQILNPIMFLFSADSS